MNLIAKYFLIHVYDKDIFFMKQGHCLLCVDSYTTKQATVKSCWIQFSKSMGRDYNFVAKEFLSLKCVCSL